MELKSPTEVVKLLQTRLLVVKTGLWLMPSTYLGHEIDEAIRLGVSSVDFSHFWLDKLPEGTKFISVTPEKVLERLDEIAESSDSNDCVLIYNFDLLLARLNGSKRQYVWESLFSGMPHRTRSLLITMPSTATELCPPPGDLHYWTQSGRLAGEANILL